MDMPYHLKTLPPEAIDILRYFSEADVESAHTDDIIENTGLSDRMFGKAIRRLVTKNLLTMERDQHYRLTHHGSDAVRDLRAYDSVPRAERPPAPEPRYVQRRLVVVVPRTLQSGQPTNVYVGFDDAYDDEFVELPMSVLLRLSVVAGDPTTPQETPLMLDNRAARQTFEISAGRSKRTRLRLHVDQLLDDAHRIESVGGMFVEVPVSTDTPDLSLVAFGIDLRMRDES